MRYFIIAALLAFGMYCVKMPVLLAWFFSITMVTYMAYYLDKKFARNNGWRVPGSVLLNLGFSGGTLGALAASQVHRHKTSKVAFRQKFWFGTILQVLILVIVIYAIQTGKVPNLLPNLNPVQTKRSPNLMPSLRPANRDRVAKQRPTPRP